MAARTPVTHGPIPMTYRNNDPAIWCYHCHQRHTQIADMNRHYRVHPCHAIYYPAEQQFWVFENYHNSRHGTTSAAQIAAARTQEVVTHMSNNGPVPTTAPIGQPASAAIGYAVLAINFRGGVLSVQRRLNGTLVYQLAPPLPALVQPALGQAVNVPPPAAPPAVGLQGPPQTTQAGILPAALPAVGLQGPPQTTQAATLPAAIYRDFGTQTDDPQAIDPQVFDPRIFYLQADAAANDTSATQINRTPDILGYKKENWADTPGGCLHEAKRLSKSAAEWEKDAYRMRLERDTKFALKRAKRLSEDAKDWRERGDEIAKEIEEDAGHAGESMDVDEDEEMD